MRRVGEQLGNTPAVARTSYVSPASVAILLDHRALLAIFFLPQIAFVAGVLALLRTLRLRRLPIVADAELRVARRRTAVALGAGALTIAWLAVYAFEFGPELGPGWVTTAYALAASLILPLGAAALATGRSAAATPIASWRAANRSGQVPPAGVRLIT